MRPFSRPPRRIARPGAETPLTVLLSAATFGAMFRSVMLTSRGHIDLLRVASAACCRRGC
ncbi:putative leader peptide [Streptomyces sp. NPDC050392]|uniref:putative leader peptide n=1 Tax=Streptomyces sp. NPDC050392 TaxID=3155782 RepID=UPI0034170127